ncbi:MAG: hypothetical protein AMXMBFR72_35040 [Betaproteobacteria bacterium]
MSGEKDDAKTGAGWPAVTLSLDRNRPGDTSVRAAMWPTLKLDTDERWFDELYVWTEGFQPGTMQRARIQLNALNKAFVLLEREKVRRIGVTLSFGTVERCLDLVTDAFDAHRFHTHRIVVLLRGQLDRLRSPYRVQSFIDWLRSMHVPVGYRLSAPRVSMELRAIDLVQPDFAKLLAPASKRPEFWEDVLLEARVAGLRTDRLIVAGIETREQRALAVQAGFGFAQGSAIRRAYDPPSIRTPPTLPPQGAPEAAIDDTQS